VIDSEPSTFEMWEDAVIEKNDVWTVVPRPHGKSVVTSKWLYKIKHAIDGSMRNTREICGCGFSQKEGIDYDRAPVARYTSIRIIISLAIFWLETSLIDVKIFLNGEVEQEVYIEQPKVS
jgi:hypothetical protein